MKGQPFSLKKRMQSFAHAWRGLKDLLRYEHNSRIHLVAAVLAITMGIWLKLRLVEWLFIILSIGLVLAMELMNSALERAIDLATKEQIDVAKQAKDMAAGAVLVVSFAAAIIGILIFGPKLWALL